MILCYFIELRVSKNLDCKGSRSNFFRREWPQTLWIHCRSGDFDKLKEIAEAKGKMKGLERTVIVCDYWNQSHFIPLKGHDV